MPRRYPRLCAKDRQGQMVSIPLSIAPRLYADEKFVSLPQRKVDEIAEANERVRTQETVTTALSPDTTSKATDETAYKADDESLLHENVGSSITGTHSPERSSASSSQHRQKHCKGRGKKRVRRLWTTQEDKVVLAAVLNNDTGPSLIGRLPNRSRSAVLKRFYVMKEKVKRDGGKLLKGGEGYNRVGHDKLDGRNGDGGIEDVEEEKIDEGTIDVDSDNDMEDDEDGVLERDGVSREEEESLDEYESYDEGDEEDEDVDEDKVDDGRDAVEDGYRPDEEMDVIGPL